jgi:hypothetical protein
MEALLRHPLTVALVGVVITGILVPYIARRWQDQQKALELRADLAANITESLMSLIAPIETARARHEALTDDADPHERQPKLQDELHKVQKSLAPKLQEFEIHQVVIGTKLHAYLRDQSIGDRWDQLAKAAIRYVGRDLVFPEIVHQEKTALVRDVLDARMAFGASWFPARIRKRRHRKEALGQR